MRYQISLAFLFFAVFAIAQPTIDGTNFVQAEDVFTYTNVDPIVLVDIDIQEEGGEDLTWDFSELDGLMEQTETYLNVDDTPTLFQFFFNNEFFNPNTFSTHALSINSSFLELPVELNVANAFTYFRNDDEGYFLTGNAAEIEGIPIASPYDTLERVYQFPLEFGNQDTNRFYFLTEVPSLGTAGQWGTRINHVDAWGTMITPYGEFEVLRVRSERATTDTVYIELFGTGQLTVRPLQVIYDWISPEAGGVVASLIYNGGVPTSFRYLSNESALSVSEPEEIHLGLFPNPANGEVRIEFPAPTKADVFIFDSSGRLMTSKGISSGQTLPVSHLANGIYQVTIKGNGFFATERLSVFR